MKRNYDMTSGPLMRPMILFALPLMASSVLQLLFNAADTVVVGRFAGSNSLAAVGSTAVVINLIINLFIGLSVGANVVCAQYIGAREEEKVSAAVHTSVMVSLISGVFLAFIGFFLAHPMLKLMGSPYDVIDLATLYMKIIFLGMPANMLYNFGSAILRAKGDTKRPLYCLTIAGVINVLFNLLFVIVFKMDVAGVALATIISQYISAALVTLLLIREDSILKLDLKKLSIDGYILKQVARVGIPSGLQGMMFSISNIFIQSRINSFGSTVVAGNSAASSLEGFVYVIINAFSQASVTYTSQNYGAKKYHRIGKVHNIALGLAMAAGGTAGILMWVFGKYTLGIYSTDEMVIAAGLLRMTFICLPHFLSIPMDVVTCTLRGMGYSFQPMIMMMIGVCVLRLLWLIFGFPFWPVESAIYISYPVTWTITGIAETVFFIKMLRKLRASAEITAETE